MSYPKYGLTFEELAEANIKRNKEVFAQHGCDNWEPNDWAVAAVGELGELCNLLKKIKRGDKIDDVYFKLLEELGGTVVYLDFLARSIGTTLEAATVYAFEDVSRRRGSTVFLGVQCFKDRKI